MRRPKVPRTLLVIAFIFLVIGSIAWRAMPALTTEEQLSGNVLLATIPFVLLFVAILLTYIAIITMAVRAFNDLIKRKLYDNIMRVVIGGIMVGILGLFQPWEMRLYTLGFVVLLISTLVYILWSHVVPQHADYHQSEMVTATDG
ncbi:MAG: hypothetical protein GY762_19365 [Proteobacteria bacterium]|nr:hypothetical protein [Pseudomonadota bacterium]